MGETVKFNEVKSKIINFRGQNTILDSDVAALYGVETREVNQAIKNNPDKFPQIKIFTVKISVKRKYFLLSD
jgi:hypothetical protein